MNVSLADAGFWLAVACCVVAQAAIVRSAAVRRSPIAGNAAMPPLRRPVELAWTLVPAVVLALVLVMTWRAIHAPAGVVILDESGTVHGGAR